jgi:glycosyltransferase involved in cell wall biosynthesis
MKSIKKLSIIIPVYNEEKTVELILRKVLSVKLNKIKKQLIVINDGSTDASLEKIKRVKDKRITVINKIKNEGKGAAIRDGLKKVSGDVVVIQDADMEYNPHEFPLLLQPIVEMSADVVYGSRFVTTQPRRVLYFWHSLGNNILTLISNLLTNLNLTDMETCYKMFTSSVAKKLDIQEDRFGFEPEFTVKVAKMNVAVFEVGISYSGRSYKEGKKVNWIDGLYALWCLIKYSFLQQPKEIDQKED